MRRSFACLTVAALCCLGGCGDRYKDAVDQQVANYAEFAAVLRDVKDESSMKEAEDKLQRRAAHFQKSSRRMRDLPKDVDPETALRIEPERRKMEAAVIDIQREATRIQSLPGGREFIQRVGEIFGGSP